MLLQMLDAFQSYIRGGGGTESSAEGRGAAQVSNADAVLLLSSCARLGHVPSYIHTEDVIEGFCLQRMGAFSPKELSTVRPQLAAWAGLCAYALMTLNAVGPIIHKEIKRKKFVLNQFCAWSGAHLWCAQMLRACRLAFCGQ